MKHCFKCVLLIYYSHRMHGTAIFYLSNSPFKSAIHGSVNISIAWILWDWYLYHVLSADCPWYLVWVQILQISQPLSMTKSCQKGRLRSCTDFLGGGFNHVLFCHYLGRWSNLTNIFQSGRNHYPIFDWSFYPSARNSFDPFLSSKTTQTHILSSSAFGEAFLNFFHKGSSVFLNSTSRLGTYPNTH